MRFHCLDCGFMTAHPRDAASHFDRTGHGMWSFSGSVLYWATGWSLSAIMQWARSAPLNLESDPGLPVPSETAP